MRDYFEQYREFFPDRFGKKDRRVADELMLGILNLVLAEYSLVPQAGDHETQESISAWATATFGPAGSNLSCAIRANREMAELLTALSRDDNDPKAAEEVADVVICLMRLMARLNADIQDAINRKMAINRGRKWKLDGDGHGSHIKELPHQKDCRPSGAT